MALATKCPHCSTIFRVAHDQLKLRGGIVRCGACNEVFDGNAALVEPALKQAVIIDIPASPLAAPTTSPELEALITTLDARHTDAPDEEDPRAGDAEAGMDADIDAEVDIDVEVDIDTDAAAQAEAAAEAIAEAEAVEEAFDLDLDVDLDGEAAPNGAEARRPAPWEDDAAPAAYVGFDLAGDDAQAAAEEADGALSIKAADEELADALAIETDDAADAAAYDAADASPRRPAYPPLSALDDEDAPALPSPGYHDGRREPTLDQPDEHLTAVALHDSFELDAYPHPTRDADHEDEDEDVVTLSGSAAGIAGGGSQGNASNGIQGNGNGGSRGNGQGNAGNGDATSPATPVSAGLAGDDDEPGFVKRDRRRRQFGKAARVGMALGIPLLLAALAAQVVGTFRNPLAAAVPALKPALVSACALAGCKVELPAQIDALSIEQGELQTLADKVFSFSTTLRNQSRSAQAWPHIELILNDDANKPVLRRVFAPRDYLANPADAAKGFGPRSEQSVKLHFELGQVKASGYHIAVFYP